MAEPQLMKNEEIFRTIHPHFFGMYKLYLIWFYLVAVSILFMVKREALIAAVVGKMSFLQVHNHAYLAMWVLALVLPAIVIAVSRISLRWIVWLVLALGLGIYLKEFTRVGIRGSGIYVDNVENLTILALGVLGILGTELYRRSHSYLVTNQRIVVRYGGIGSSERSLLYSKVDDLILAKPLIGSILGFGSIIPITSSGIGMGADMAGGGMAVGAKLFGANFGVGVGGGHSQNVPKESITYTLFNVPQPDVVYQYILGQMSERETGH